MSFNEQELRKIQSATSGWFKKSARTAISLAISLMRPRIASAMNLPIEQRQTELKRLVNEASAARRTALLKGANSHGDPEWAAAAVCESWLHELTLGTRESIARVEAVVDELERR
ncbi:MAG: hypothetical protein H6961_01325 [Chromatiaceae bacterium]|nr:hypothetical protein [Chromatiaceae bacterium]HPE79630.1 hypothetical protein [Gammaproteobacteria bacterium]